MRKGSLIQCRFVNLDNDINDNFDYYIENKDDPEDEDNNIMYAKDVDEDNDGMTVLDEDGNEYGDIVYEKMMMEMMLFYMTKRMSVYQLAQPKWLRLREWDFAWMDSG